MKFELENDVLRLFFEGELNSSNAEYIEKDIDEITSKNAFKSIILDMEKLNYISSAGIRIIIRLKHLCSQTSIEKVQEDVGDIFDMVGLQNVLSITRL